MTKIWDTGTNKGALVTLALSDGNTRPICYCEADTTYASIYIRLDGANTYLCYGHGDDNIWTEEILVRSDAATGRLAIQATVVSASLDVHQTGGANDQVHIVWVASTGVLYHSELVVPNIPEINGNWSAWGGFRYQRIDNTNAVKNASVSIDGNGDPHVVWNNNNQTVHYNLGNGVPPHTFGAGNTIQLANPAQATNPTCVAIIEEGRDIHAYWENGNIIQWSWCDNLLNPLLIGSWSAPASVLTFAGPRTAAPPSSYYWWDGGSATQMMVVACDDQGNIESNWYDEGNVNGWGGGWRGSTTETVSADFIQLTQVSANDFILIHIPFGGGAASFSFTNYGTTYDFVGALFKDCTNSAALEIGSECRGREHDDDSCGMLHIQAVSDIMFDLVRDNIAPVTSVWDPDNGDRENEAAAITLSWTFTDAGQAQSKRRVQVDTFEGSFAAPIYDSGEQVGAAHNWDIPALTLAFNTHYSWRVKVWDDEVGDEYDPYSEGDWEG